MKRTVSLFLAFVLLCCLIGCTKQEVSSPPSSDPSPSVSAGQSSSTGSSSKEESSKNDSSSGTQDPKPENPDEETPPPDSIHSIHYCYEKLNDLQKGYYDKLYEAVNKMETSWIVLGTAEETYRIDIAVVRTAMANDHPEIFWLPSYYAVALGNAEDGSKTAMMYFTAEKNGSPSYLMTRGEKERMVRELESEIKKITSAVTSKDPYEIELELHDMLCKKAEYSDDKNDPMIYSAYGAIVNSKALCEGYSKAMQLLLSRFGITAVSLTGTVKGEGHMWNAVLLDGEWYHLDSTWNDTSSVEISHEFFNLSDSQLGTERIFSKDYTLLREEELVEVQVPFNINRPVCTGTRNNYFVRTGFALTEENAADLPGYLVLRPESVVEVGVTKEFGESIYANAQRFLSEINNSLQKDFSESGFKVEKIVFSDRVIWLYKKEI